MGYQKNGDDNGRVEGTLNELTSEHIMEKTEYFKHDQSGNDKWTEENRKWDEEYMEDDIFSPKNDTKEIITEVTEDGNYDT